MIELDAALAAAGISDWDDPAETFAALHEALGEEATVLHRYELEARSRGADAAAITVEERRLLAHEVLAVRGYEVLSKPSGIGVEVVEYDPSWPSRFEEWRERLNRALGHRAISIDHMGSTAVPGLAAKPIVDIVVGVADPEDEAAFVGSIESLGLWLRSRDPGHRYFRADPPVPRVVQVHVAAADGDWRREHLLFRDYLRAHEEVAAEYGELKRRLAAELPDDRVAYTDLKSSFIRQALRDAEAWAAESGWEPS